MPGLSALTMTYRVAYLLPTRPPEWREHDQPFRRRQAARQFIRGRRKRWLDARIIHPDGTEERAKCG